MVGFELGEETPDRIYRAEDLGVLQDQRDRTPPLRGSAAAGEHELRDGDQEDGGAEGARTPR